MDSRRRLISRRCIHEAGGRPKRSRQAFTQAVVRLRLRLLIRDAHLPSLRGDPSPPPSSLSLTHAPSIANFTVASRMTELYSKHDASPFGVPI
jgi:hypothetical protein